MRPVTGLLQLDDDGFDDLIVDSLEVDLLGLDLGVVLVLIGGVDARVGLGRRGWRVLVLERRFVLDGRDGSRGCG